MAKPSGGVGRPSKRYTTTDDQVHLEVDVRQDDILVALLGRALKMLPAEVAEEMAEEVGLEYGKAMAETLEPTSTHRSFQGALPRSPMPFLPTASPLAPSTPTRTKSSKSLPSTARSATPSSSIR